MGLAERRAIKAFQDTNYPALEQQIQAAAGTAIPVEVDWNSLAFEGYADSYADSLPNIFFVPLIKGFEKVAFDDMGKEAVRDGISKIVIKGSADYSSYWAELENKVLTLTYSFSNVDYVDDRVEVLVKKLEAKL
jgi:hypothetical protein